MKTMKNLLALLLIIAITIPMTFTVTALTAGDESAFLLQGGTVEVDGVTDQTIEICFISKYTDNLAAVEGSFDLKDSTGYITLDELTPYYNLSGNDSYVDNQIGYFRLFQYPGVDFQSNTNIVSARYIVSGDTPAGTYVINLKEVNIMDGSSDSNAIPDATYSTTITVTEAPAAGGGEEGGDDAGNNDEITRYTAGLTADKTEINVGDTVKVSINVGGSEENFASSQIEITYDTESLTFDPDAQEHSLNGATIRDENGTITLVDHGSDQATGEVAYQLVFTGKALSDNAEITLLSAAFDTAENAPTQNIPQITLDEATKSVSVSIANKKYTITLPSDFQTDDSTTVEEGGSFTFSAKDPYYDYTVTVDNGHTAVYDEDTGLWTINDIKHDLTISATKAGKKYNVTFNDEHMASTPEAQAQYMTDYTFTLKPKDSNSQYNLVSITIGGQLAPEGSYTSDENNTYTINGAYIKDEIEITTEATPVSQYSIYVTGEKSVLDLSATSVEENGSVILTLKPGVNGYVYTVTYKMGTGEETTIGQWNEGENGTKTYTISNITADVTIKVEKSLEQNFTLEIKEDYLALDGKDAHLVIIKGATLNDNQIYTYNGQDMYLSDQYDTNGTYIYLVETIADAGLTDETVLGNLAIAAKNGDEVQVVYNGDVNMAGDGIVDANDAQFVYNMYNVTYSTIEEIGMEKFLRADMIGDGIINVNDALAILDIILPKAATN